MRHIIFDFDGTLADSLPVAVALAQELAPGVDLSDEELQKLRNMSARDIIKYSGIPYWRLLRLLLKGKKMLSQRLGDLKVFPGIPAVLRELHERGFQIAVVSSNTEQNIRTVLEREHIDQYVSGVYGNLGLFNKSRAFKTVLRDQKAQPDDAIYIGDEVRDIEAAKKGHIPIISVTWGYNGEEILKKYNPTYLVRTPAELLKVIIEHDSPA